MYYNGVIIEESLQDKNVLRNVNIVSTIVEKWKTNMKRLGWKNGHYIQWKYKKVWLIKMHKNWLEHLMWIIS